MANSKNCAVNEDDGVLEIHLLRFIVTHLTSLSSRSFRT